MDFTMTDCLTRIAHLESAHARLGYAQTSVLRHP
ncbi:hypothetical protein ABIB57_002829 [Devosia sp. UYZn731]